MKQYPKFKSGDLRQEIYESGKQKPEVKPWAKKWKEEKGRDATEAGKTRRQEKIESKSIDYLFKICWESG